jgi:hypothetical protein
MTTEQKKMIVSHAWQLNSLFNLDICNEEECISLCKSLRRLENKGHILSEKWCNGDIEQDEFEMRIDKILSSVIKTLKKYGLEIINKDMGIIFNADPRGYCLKINLDMKHFKKIPFYRDLGDFGILAPNFS